MSSPVPPGKPRERHTAQINLDMVLDSVPQAVLVINQDRSIAYANAAAESLFSTSSTQIMRKGLAALLPENAPVFLLVERIFSKFSPVNEYQVDVSTPRTGDGKIVDIYGAPMPDDATRAVLIFRERSMEDRIARHLSHRSAARSVTGLAAMLAHEIKNPLSGIRGAAQLLEGNLGEGDRELAQLIKTETDRVVHILDRMEVFSNETPIEVEPVNMHSVLGQVRRVAKAGFAEKIEFREFYDPSLPMVSGSHDGLVQVFLNLVKNAAEALEQTQSPRIMLASAYRPGFRVQVPGASTRSELPLEFTVTDNGHGIPDEIRGDIFDPFVTSRTNGTGLGLALVAKIIGKHGGVVECDSSVDGTVFRLLLPAWSEADTGSSGVAAHGKVAPGMAGGE